MSRSNPSEHTPNPAVRWFEWNGEKGTVRYYDKETKANVDCPLPFGFVLLDELASVRGWHEASKSGIYSNEVRDTREDVMVVKAFKMPAPLAEGLYKNIKDRANVVGGRFTANCYIAFKGDSGTLQIGSLRFKGAALGGWMEFRKEHRRDIYKQAIEIVGSVKGQKGRVIFHVPTFTVKPLSDASNDAAVKLDQELQAFLDGYLNRTRLDQAEVAATNEPEPGQPEGVDDMDYAMPTYDPNVEDNTPIDEPF